MSKPMTAEQIEQALAEREAGAEAQPELPHRDSLQPFSAPRIRVVPPEPNADEIAAQRAAALERRAQREEAARAELEAHLGSKPECRRIKRAVLRINTLSALLYGPTGSGKTAGARYLVRHVAPRNFCRLKAIKIESAYRRHGLGAGLPPEIERGQTAPVLVIDDIGREVDTKPLFEILDHRYDAHLPIIATTGLTEQELSAHLSAATARRLVHQFAGYEVLVVDCFGGAK